MATETTQQDAASALYTLPAGTTLTDSVRVGRTLTATRLFEAGEKVLQDTPVLEWDPTEELPAAVEAARTAVCPFITASEHEKAPLQHNFAAAAVAFARGTSRARRIILDMHVPDLPVGPLSLRLVQFAAAMAAWAVNEERPEPIPVDSNELSCESFIRAMLAAKVNSHRGPGGNWRLFAVASKLAHSCDPNTMYVLDKAAFVTIRPVRPGERFSFSYVGGPLLVQGTPQRQQRLIASHLFTCQCDRCRGRDLSRQLPCPAKDASGDACSGFITRIGSSNNLRDGDVFPGLAWQCDACRAEFSDDHLQQPPDEYRPALLAREEELSAEIGVLGGGTPYKYKRLKELVKLVADDLGNRHWCFVSLCFHLMQYFRLMVQHGCPEARHMVAAWGIKFLRGLENVGLDAVVISNHSVGKDADEGGTPSSPGFVHMVAASAVITMVEMCSTDGQYKPMLHQLAIVAAPLVLALYSAEAPSAKKILDFANAGREEGASAPASLGSLLAVAPSSVRGAPLDLLGLWDRIVALVMMRQYAQQNSGFVPSGQGMTPGLSVGSVSQGSLDSLESPDMSLGDPTSPVNTQQAAPHQPTPDPE